MQSRIQGLSGAHHSLITIDMGGGVSVDVDLAGVNEQRRIASRLSSDDFQKIRGLKAKLGSSDKTTGQVCDYVAV